MLQMNSQLQLLQWTKKIRVPEDLTYPYVGRVSSTVEKWQPYPPCLSVRLTGEPLQEPSQRKWMQDSRQRIQTSAVLMMPSSLLARWCKQANYVDLRRYRYCHVAHLEHLGSVQLTNRDNYIGHVHRDIEEWWGTSVASTPDQLRWFLWAQNGAHPYQVNL